MNRRFSKCKTILVSGALSALLGAVGCREDRTAPADVAEQRAELERLFAPAAPGEEGATHVAVVRKNADGTFTRGCVDNADSAMQLMRARPALPAVNQ